jgi:hypothetical protein
MQPAYTLAPGSMKAGLCDSSSFTRKNSRVLAGKGRAGYGCFRVPTLGSPGSSNGVDPGQVWQQPSHAAAADVDAILATGASSASVQLIDTEADGAYATATFMPPRNVTLVLSSHADWDATNATLTYIDQGGITRTETLAIPNGGNATVTSTGFVAQFVSLSIPAQAGTGGTYTIGIAAIDASVTLADWEGVAEFRPFQIAEDTDNDFGDKEVITVVRKGVITVVLESGTTAATGGDVYVGTGASNLGKFRHDNTSAIAVTGARFAKVDLTVLLADVEFF